MTPSVRSAARVVLALLVVTLAALAVTGTTEARTTAASHAKATDRTAGAPRAAAIAEAAAVADTRPVSRPCGRRHYPPCPPKPKVSASPHRVHRGHRVTISVEHYRGSAQITVHLAGQGRYIFLGSSTTGPRGNRTFGVVVPRSIPTGHYTLYVQVGASVTPFALTVSR